MDLQLAIILALTFLIHLIGTLAYAFRLAGVKTGKIAIALSLFNILVLVSRTSNSFQGPFIAKRVEQDILGTAAYDLGRDFSLILLSASAATLVGGLLIPTMHRYAAHAIESFSRSRSVPRLIRRAATPRGLRILLASLTWPRFSTLLALRSKYDVPARLIVLSVLANALWTVGVLSAIYAGTLDPDFRVTASTLSSVINGLATILLFVIVDPYLAGLMDDVARGRETEQRFRRAVLWMVGSRLAGTITAQLLLVPGAYLIILVAHLI
jgi:hypothetical protein